MFSFNEDFWTLDLLGTFFSGRGPLFQEIRLVCSYASTRDPQGRTSPDPTGII